MYLTISQIHVLPPFKRAKIRSVESVVCALGRRPSAKREGDVAALAATSAKKPPLVIYQAHTLQPFGIFSHKNLAFFVSHSK